MMFFRTYQGRPKKMLKGAGKQNDRHTLTYTTKYR